jgi:ABC-2 type transport system permease protein
MIRMLYIIKKEVLEISRDAQSLFMLLLMPAIFILVMSLSMQPLFQPGSDFKIKIIAQDRDATAESRKYLDIMKKMSNYVITETAAAASDDSIRDAILNGTFSFGLVINRNFSTHIRDLTRTGEGVPITLLVEPSIQVAIQMGVKNQLVMELVKLRAHTFFGKNADLMSYAGIREDTFMPPLETLITTRHVFKNIKETSLPNATQQSVPAWLVFSMYFIVMSISLIFHTEKNNGTFSRIRSINIKYRHLLAGKIVSYYVISMVQTACMLCVGLFLVPLLGGDTLRLGNSPVGLFIVASCVGLNAVSYGLLVSAASKNNQVAGSLGSVLIIIFAAIGGIMVPKFVMPTAMQKLSVISPLSWGLEGFLDILLRNGGVSDIAPECALLAGTSLAMLVITGIVLKKKIL